MRQYKRDRPDLLQRAAGLFRRAVRAAGEADVIACMRDDNQAERTGALEDAEIFRVVERRVLIGRVKLDPAQPKRLDPVQLLPPVRAVRMDAAEGEQICDERVNVVRCGGFVATGRTMERSTPAARSASSRPPGVPSENGVRLP